MFLFYLQRDLKTGYSYIIVPMSIVNKTITNIRRSMRFAPAFNPTKLACDYSVFISGVFPVSRVILISRKGDRASEG